MTPKAYMPPAFHGTTVGALSPRGIGAALLALVLLGMAFGLATAQAQEAASEPEQQVLVSNLGVGVSGSGGIQRTLHTGRPGFAQAFTTGTTTGAYALGSIGIHVSHLFDATTAGDHLQVTVNGAASGGGPGGALCTLTNPSSLSAPGVIAFGAPTGEGSCPQLQTETTYFIVIEWLNPSGTDRFAEIPQTFPTEHSAASDEDPGGAEGWSIADRSHYLNVSGDSRTWTEFVELASFKIVVKGAAVSAAQANRLPTGEPQITGTAQVGETLAAVTTRIEDDDGLDNVAYSYQWIRVDGATESNIGADNASYTLVEDDENKTVKVKVSFTDDAGNDETLTSDPTEPVAAKPNSPATGKPTISGTAQVGETLTAATTGIEDDDGRTRAIFTYSWNGGERHIQGATGTSYTLTRDQVGLKMRVIVAFLDDNGNSEVLASDPTEPVAARPNSPATGKPTISGTAQVDETLTAATTGIEDDDGLPESFTYQWFTTDEDGVSTRVKASHSNATYRLRPADKGKTVTVRVNYTDQGGTVESVVSDPTEPVIGVDRTERPHDLTATLEGDAVVLTWTDAVNGPDHDAYQILRHRPEQGESEPLVYVNRYESADPTYTDTEVEPGVLYVYRVKAVVNIFGELGESSGPAQVRVPAGEDEADADAPDGEETNSEAEGGPTITGTAQVGETLTADTSGIEDDDGLDSVSYSYQWIRVDGATESNIGSDNASYTLAEDDENKTIKVKVSFTDDAGNEETLTSDATEAVAAKPNAPAEGQPTISGTPQVGETLTAETGAIEDDDGLDNATYSYQWLADDANIPDATGSTYTLADAEEGKTIKVKVSFTDDAGNEETLTSKATEEVAAKPNTPPEGQPTISGTPRVGETLTAITLGIEDDDGLDNVAYSYQWIRVDGATEGDIPDATSSGYELADSDLGKTIKVKVSFTDDAGNDETLTSAATEAVAARPPLTASLSSVPESHNGTDDFTFEIRFSEELDLSFRTLKFHAFTVTGGTVEKARRLEEGSNIAWRITVSPASNTDVAVLLPATANCKDEGAICTRDGRKLSNSLEFTVSGPGG